MNDTTDKTVPVMREFWPAVQGEAGGHAYSSYSAEIEGTGEDTGGIDAES